MVGQVAKQKGCAFAVSTLNVSQQVSNLFVQQMLFPIGEHIGTVFLAMPQLLSNDFKSRKDRLMAASEFSVQSAS